MPGPYVPNSPGMEEFLRIMEEKGLGSPKGARVLGQSPSSDSAPSVYGSPTPFEGMGAAGGEQRRAGAGLAAGLLEGGGGAGPDAIPEKVRNFVMMRADPIPGLENPPAPPARGPEASELSPPPGGLNLRGAGSEPWEGEVDRDRLSRIGRSQNLIDIAEGLGNIEIPSAGAARIKALTGRDVLEPTRPFVAEGLRRERARAEDELTMGEVEALRRAGINVPPGMSASRMKGMGLGSLVRPLSTYQKESLDMQGKRLEESKRRTDKVAEEIKGRHKMNARAKIIGEFDSDPEVKKYRAAIGSVGRLKELLALGTSAGDRAATTILPKALGEVGNLSTYDVSRHETRMGILNQVQDSISQAIKGRLSAPQREEMLGMIDRMGSSAAEELAEYAKPFSTRYAKAYEMDPAEIQDILGLSGAEATGSAPSSSSAGSLAGKVKATDPKTGETRLIPAAKAAEARARGLTVEG